MESRMQNDINAYSECHIRDINNRDSQKRFARLMLQALQSTLLSVYMRRRSFPITFYQGSEDHVV